VPFKGPKGDQLVSTISPIARSYGVFAITNVNKYPEATMRWVDHFYGDEGSIFFRYGIEGQTFVKKPDGAVEYTDEILNDKRGSSVAIGQFTIYPGGGAPQWINDKNSSGINPPQVQEAANMLKPFMPKVVLGPPLFEDEARESVEKLKGDIDRYVAESNAKFITGSTSFDKWDEYTTTLKKLKIDELEKLYQQAYDTLNKK
jgi:putative aldouronate transport system substrate-binding protein